MLKLCLIITIIAFLISFASFMLALISRYNVKRKMMMQGKNPDGDAPDFAEMFKADPKLSRQYQIAIKVWGISSAILIMSIVAAFYFK